jgi:hypothetical protein
MTRSGISIFVFGIYLVLLGAILIAAPNLILSLVSITSTPDIWVRLSGMLLLLLAFYYLMAARQGVTAFYHWTLYTRLSAVLFLITFVLADLVGPVVFLFWLGDLAGAIWTWWALRSERNISQIVS